MVTQGPDQVPGFFYSGKLKILHSYWSFCSLVVIPTILQLNAMSVMSIRIDDEKRKKLKAIASLQGKTMNSIVEELIDQYIEEFTNNNEWSDDVIGIMKVSEPSFEEWENDEDAIYDEL
jgi:hypothetical protein